MYCARCGTNNAKTSKFCRECGRRMDLGIPSGQTVEEEQAAAEQPVDSVKVGELLFQAFQNLEGGKLDEALKLCQEALRLHPESTAGHSLVAMVFEKRGELGAALRHYDRVVMLNPKSVADREKRDELRRRLRGVEEPPVWLKLWNSYIETAGRFLASKRPWPEAIGAFILTFGLLMALWPKPPAPTQAAPQTPPSEQASTAPTESYPAPQEAPPSGGALPFAGGSSSGPPAPQQNTHRRRRRPPKQWPPPSSPNVRATHRSIRRRQEGHTFPQ